MSTRILMTASALVMAALGVGASFLPQELLAVTGVGVTPVAILLVQVMGAMYLGLSALNWMSRGFITGGIYGRPLTIANVTHFVVGAIALIKAAIASQFMAEISLMAAIYSALAAWFGFVLLAHPSGGPGATR